MNIHGKKIILRAIEKEDIKLLHYWANNPSTQDIMGDIHFPSSIEFHHKWFESQIDDKINLRFIIEIPKKGVIGLASIINIDWKNGHAYHGMWLGEHNIKGIGYGTDTLLTIMRYAFDELNLERLDGQIIEYNEISYNFYCKKHCWKKEGIRKNYWFRKGRYWDQILVGVTKDEYHKYINELNYWSD